MTTKKIMTLLVLTALLCSLTFGACAAPGTYTGVGSGINGELSVAVTLDDAGAIAAVDVSNNNETYGVGKIALDYLAQAVVNGQTANVDLVSGATVSSAAFRVALNDALKQAGVYDQYAAAPAYVAPVEPLENTETDVVVIGAGLAGLMASIEAANDGLSVTLLEKQIYPGGDTLIAVGWISGHGNRMQLAAGTEVSIPNDPQATPLNYKIAVESGPALDAMMDYGVQFVETTGYSTAFYPGYEKGGGAAMEALANKAESLGVNILYATPAVDLIEENGVCVGVIAEQADGNRFEIRAKATVIAAGGYQQNKEAVAKYNPEYANLICSAMPSGTGDWLEWLPKFDIALYGMDSGMHMQPATTNTHRAIAFMVSPSVVVDANGDRFANESTSYNPVAKAALAAGVNEMYLILDETMKANESVPGLTDSLIAAGSGKVFSSIEDIAAEYGLTNLVATVERYNQMAETGTDEDFGRTNFTALSGDAYYVIKARPSTYASYGGILIDNEFHVQNNAGETVPGLYAVGAASGSYLVLENTGASSPGLTAAMTSGFSLGNQLAGEIAK